MNPIKSFELHVNIVESKHGKINMEGGFAKIVKHFYREIKESSMQILKDSITCLAGQGRITLQIPQYSIWLGPEARQPETEEVPDEWIMTLRSSASYPAVGKESGYSFLTRAGWLANKDKIKEAFELSNSMRGSWEDFEKYVERHFQSTREKTIKRIAFMEKKTRQLQEGLDKL